MPDNNYDELLLKLVASDEVITSINLNDREIAEILIQKVETLEGMRIGMIWGNNGNYELSLIVIKKGIKILMKTFAGTKQEDGNYKLILKY